MLAYVLARLRREKMQIQDSVFWILYALGIVLLSLFPQIGTALSSLIGISLPVNFIFLVFIFFSYVKLLSLSAKISQLERKNEELAYAIAKMKLQQEGAPSAANAERTAGR